LRKIAPRLAAAYHSIGDQRALDELIVQHPAAAAAIGDLYAAHEDWKRAIAEYSRFITDRSADATLLAQRAVAYEATGRWDLAAADWLRALRQQPDLAQAVFERARSLLMAGVGAFESGRWAEAIRDLEQARDRFRILMQASPGDDRVASQLGISLGYLGNALSDEHRLAEAREAIRESCRVLKAIRQPTSVDLYNLACSYANLTTLAEPGSAPPDTAERETMADRAMEALRRSIATGMTDFSIIERDHDLDPLRGRPDFRALLLDRAFPRDPFAGPSPIR
jgi:tetratricopeptide (TPR) repeat protein